MKKPRIIFDIGGVLFHEKDGKKPHEWDHAFDFAIKTINKIYDMDKYEIVLYTHRYTDENHINPFDDYSDGYINTINLLKDNGVKFHKLWLGKPDYEMWVDNKACHVDSNEGPKEWEKFWKRLDDIDNKCKKYNEPITAETQILDKFIMGEFSGPST